ncbi:hypothetical protein BHE74_00036477 [Ensete ventricosum]|nr:hypothetical protein BHE74_00036477 [Ensete ventricosum]
MSEASAEDILIPSANLAIGGTSLGGSTPSEGLFLQEPDQETRERAIDRRDAPSRAVSSCLLQVPHLANLDLRVQAEPHRKQNDVHKTIQMKAEHGESSLCGSPIIQEIQDTPISQHFCLPVLEAYDGGSNPMEHVAAFRVQMALYSMSDAIMCWAFPITMREVARGWYNQLPLAFIHSFDKFAREFEANFLASA